MRLTVTFLQCQCLIWLMMDQGNVRSLCTTGVWIEIGAGVERSHRVACRDGSAQCLDDETRVHSSLWELEKELGHGDHDG